MFPWKLLSLSQVVDGNISPWRPSVATGCGDGQTWAWICGVVGGGEFGIDLADVLLCDQEEVEEVWSHSPTTGKRCGKAVIDTHGIP